jgi:hypothetical protein
MGLQGPSLVLVICALVWFYDDVNIRRKSCILFDSCCRKYAYAVCSNIHNGIEWETTALKFLRERESLFSTIQSLLTCADLFCSANLEHKYKIDTKC